jgi:DnaJ-class molecular chaperone
MTKSTGKGPQRPGRMVEVQCVTCRGSGRRGNKDCSLCKGRGTIKVPER